MSKTRIFYKQRFRMPVWMQLYVVWVAVLLISAPISYFVWVKGSDTSAIDIKNKKQIGYQDTEKILTELRSKKITLKDINRHGISKNEITTLQYEGGDAQCDHKILNFSGHGSRNIIALFPMQSLNTENGLTGFLAIERLIQKATYSNNFQLVAYDDRPECYRHEKFLRYFYHLRNTSVLLFIHPNETSRYSLSIAGATDNISSKNWRNVIVGEYDIPGIFEQMAKIAFPVFQGPEGYFLNNELHAIGWNPLANNPSQPVLVTVSNIANTMLNIDAIQSGSLNNGSFWLSENKTLTANGFNWIVILIVILTWLPICNTIYRSGERLSVLPVLFSSVYYALVPFIGYVSVQALAEFTSQPLILLPVPVFCFIMLYFLRKLELSMLNFQINRISANLVWNLSLLPIAFIQPVWYIFSLPIIFLTQKMHGRYMTRILLYFLPGAFPFLYVLYRLTHMYPEINVWTPSMISQYFFDSYSFMFAVFFAVGCYLSWFFVPKKRYL